MADPDRDGAKRFAGVGTDIKADRAKSGIRGEVWRLPTQTRLRQDAAWKMWN
jgi:hypothetical protein